MTVRILLKKDLVPSVIVTGVDNEAPAPAVKLGGVGLVVSHLIWYEPGFTLIVLADVFDIIPSNSCGLKVPKPVASVMKVAESPDDPAFGYG